MKAFFSTTALLLCSLSLLLTGCGTPANSGAPQNLTSGGPIDPSPTPGPVPLPAPPPAPAPTTYDMLAWMTMDPSLAAGHHMSGTANPIYTSVQPDRFFWTKTGQGYPWDIQLYDNNYIYLWVTELNWANLRTYKVFHSPNPQLGDYNLPLTPRFVTGTPDGSPGKLASIKVQDSTYEIHSDCNTFTSHNLKNVVNEVWGPYTEALGGQLPDNLQTLIISYRYNCDASYSACKDKEEFHVAKPYGLVKWQHEVLQADGTYATPDNQTFLNRVVAGQVQPVTACF
jgi:hypothetical protein